MMLGKKIKNIAKSDRVLFTTPSHDRTAFVIPDIANYIGRKYFLHDLSEINDLDNLSEPASDILNSLKHSASILNADNVFYLVNGSTSGIIAAMLSTLKQNDKVLIARNCHKSVINGLILTGAYPVWFLPPFNYEWSIFDAVLPEQIEECLQKNQDIKAVIITSPTYEGISSDVAAISGICHKYNARLIVDEAHGALKSFAPEHFGQNAVCLGADISVQSLHKTCGAPNPCAVLLSGPCISRDKIQNALNIINTSSPSYPIMAAIEATINFLSSKEGMNKITKLLSDISELKSVFQNNEDIKFCTQNDPLKIMLKIQGLSGFDLSDILFEEFNIEDELANNSASILLTGIGTTKHKLKLLEKALKTILTTKYSYPKELPFCPIFLSEEKMHPRTAFFADKDDIPINTAFGRICAEIVAEYPPGIPILLPGEHINHEHIKYLHSKRPLIKVVR